MARLKILGGAFASLALLLLVAQLLASPAVPFRFLQGAELESESLVFRVFPTQDNLMHSIYRVRGTTTNIAPVANEELLKNGWDRAEVVGEFSFCSGWTEFLQGVTISDAGGGFSNVELRSEASLFDRLRFLVGLAKGPAAPWDL